MKLVKGADPTITKARFVSTKQSEHGIFIRGGADDNHVALHFHFLVDTVPFNYRKRQV
jgi:hypothetical protein